MIKSRTAAIVTALACGMLAGCTSLPRGAAMQTEITRDAAVADSGFAFYPVTRALLPLVDSWPAVNVETSHGWPRGGAGGSGQIIAPGDQVEVTIWDSSENSLLTTPAQRAAPLGPMSVNPDGRIFVPYVGEVRIAGMSPDRARRVIQERMVEIAPSGQVQLSMVSGRQNSVDLVSGVASPGTYPLPDRNYSVLSLLSTGGGVPTSMRNPRVKIQRGSQTYASSLDRLYETAGLDAVLRGGDKVIVEEDDRYFMSLGASGKEDLFFFERDYLTALEAISMIGGVSDSRADPSGILVLREYPRSSLAAGSRGPREQRVIFSIDLTSADGLFSAKNLQIYPQDVVLATESPVSTLRTALSLIGSGFGLYNVVNN